MRRALAACALGALLAAAPAAGHVTFTPPTVAAGEKQSFTISLPNEAEAPMTGFALTLPDGFRVVRAGHQPTWHPLVFGSKVTWAGGSLAPGSETTLRLELEAPAQTGPARLRAEQLFANGAVERWPVVLRVVSGKQPAEHVVWAAAVAGAGLLATVLFVVAVRRRRVSKLQEG